MMEEKETRKRNPPIKVWCLHNERAAIEANAKAASCRESMPTWAD
jgi:hypothetical protein